MNRSSGKSVEAATVVAGAAIVVFAAGLGVTALLASAVGGIFGWRQLLLPFAVGLVPIGIGLILAERWAILVAMPSALIIAGLGVWAIADGETSTGAILGGAVVVFAGLELWAIAAEFNRQRWTGGSGS